MNTESDGYDKIERENLIDYFLSHLSKTEQFIITRRVGLYYNKKKMTFKEMGAILNMEPYKVSECFQVAIKKLKRIGVKLNKEIKCIK